MQNFKLFVELTRLNRPIGYMLLFWPCLWGLTISYDFNYDLEIYYFYSFLFLMGSILMRSAGCIVNDIVDRNFDKKVERTKNRPCLLYTSPSPRDGLLSRMPSSA